MCIRDRLGLGHFYERQGDIERALDAYTLAGAADDRDLRGLSLIHISQPPRPY